MAQFYNTKEGLGFEVAKRVAKDMLALRISEADLRNPDHFSNSTDSSEFLILDDGRAAFKIDEQWFIAAVQVVGSPSSSTLVPLPSAGTNPPSDVGGFTCTGIALIPSGPYAGCFVVNNDGRTEESGPDSGNPYEPMGVILSPDFRTKIAEIPYFYTGQSAQGVAIRTAVSPPTLLVGNSAGNRCYELCLYDDGVNSPGDYLNAYYQNASRPTGIAYDSRDDTVWVGFNAITTVNKVDWDGTTAPPVVDSISLSFVPDQMCLDEEYNLLFYTHGANGEDGNIRCYDLTTGVDFHVCTVPRAQAIEGVYLDRDAGKFIVMSDGRYHNSFEPEPLLNAAVFVDMVIPTRSA